MEEVRLNELRNVVKPKLIKATVGIDYSVDNFVKYYRKMANHYEHGDDQYGISSLDSSVVPYFYCSEECKHNTSNKVILREANSVVIDKNKLCITSKHSKNDKLWNIKWTENFIKSSKSGPSSLMFYLYTQPGATAYKTECGTVYANEVASPFVCTVTETNKYPYIATIKVIKEIDTFSIGGSDCFYTITTKNYKFKGALSIGSMKHVDARKLTPNEVFYVGCGNKTWSFRFDVSAQEHCRLLLENIPILEHFRTNICLNPIKTKILLYIIGSLILFKLVKFILDQFNAFTTMIVCQLFLFIFRFRNLKVCDECGTPYFFFHFMHDRYCEICSVYADSKHHLEHNVDSKDFVVKHGKFTKTLIKCVFVAILSLNFIVKLEAQTLVGNLPSVETRVRKVTDGYNTDIKFMLTGNSIDYHAAIEGKAATVISVKLSSRRLCEYNYEYTVITQESCRCPTWDTSQWGGCNRCLNGEANFSDKRAYQCVEPDSGAFGTKSTCCVVECDLKEAGKVFNLAKCYPEYEIEIVSNKLHFKKTISEPYKDKNVTISYLTQNSEAPKTILRNDNGIYEGNICQIGAYDCAGSIKQKNGHLIDYKKLTDGRMCNMGATARPPFRIYEDNVGIIKTLKSVEVKQDNINRMQNLLTFPDVSVVTMTVPFDLKEDEDAIYIANLHSLSCNGCYECDVLPTITVAFKSRAGMIAKIKCDNFEQTLLTNTDHEVIRKLPFKSLPKAKTFDITCNGKTTECRLSELDKNYIKIREDALERMSDDYDIHKHENDFWGGISDFFSGFGFSNIFKNIIMYGIAIVVGIFLILLLVAGAKEMVIRLAIYLFSGSHKKISKQVDEIIKKPNTSVKEVRFRRRVPEYEEVSLDEPMTNVRASDFIK